MTSKMYEGYNFVKAQTKDLTVSSILERVFGGEAVYITENVFHYKISQLILEEVRSRKVSETEIEQD